MTERIRRLAANEALYRQLNEEIEALDRGIAEISDGTIHVVCECGDLTCIDRLVVPIDRYESIRADPTLFVVKPGHENTEVEDVVDPRSSYRVVRKRKGEGARIAEETDPRRD